MNKIRELRTQRGWRQEDLAARLGVGRQAVGNYETGERGIDAETICRLCDIFGCTADYLLCRSETPTPELTPEEESLLMAWRRCDDRARDMVLVALAPFASSASSTETA